MVFGKSSEKISETMVQSFGSEIKAEEVEDPPVNEADLRERPIYANALDCRGTAMRAFLFWFISFFFSRLGNEFLRLSTFFPKSTA